MRLFSYVVTGDAGFAPNPYHDFCTLAVCKPKIRKTASVGDWVIGTGSKTRGFQNRLVYAMLVTEEMTFDAYWMDPRFHRKRPDIHGNRVQVCGDNIYFRKKRRQLASGMLPSRPPSNSPRHDCQQGACERRLYLLGRRWARDSGEVP